MNYSKELKKANRSRIMCMFYGFFLMFWEIGLLILLLLKEIEVSTLMYINLLTMLVTAVFLFLTAKRFKKLIKYSNNYSGED